MNAEQLREAQLEALQECAAAAREMAFLWWCDLLEREGIVEPVPVIKIDLCESGSCDPADWPRDAPEHPLGY